MTDGPSDVRPDLLAIGSGLSAQGAGPGAVAEPGDPGPGALVGQPVIPPLIQRETTKSQQKLRALVIGVKGRAQWRQSEEESWRAAKVNDILRPGADIRTGLRSSVALRVGKNATVLVDRATRLSLPVILQDGQTLRTRAAVRRGRADFKVDSKVELIGLVNDFEVLT
ncbi:MAG: FecR family protein, partial [Planctomycetota bacterium]